MYKYPLAKEDVFETIQGEGILLGLPMVFIRLAGCSIGCDGCDTDYSVSHRMTASDIIGKAQSLSNQKFCWITGGEPTDHPIGDLVIGLKKAGFIVCLATSGVRETCSDGWRVHEGYSTGGVDFLSVSPHSWDSLRVNFGTQCNIVPELNGLMLGDFVNEKCIKFANKFVTPKFGNLLSEKTCIDWVKNNTGWRLGIQAHKTWGIS